MKAVKKHSVVFAGLVLVVGNCLAATADDLVLVYYKKAPVTVGALTGVPYSEAVAAVKKVSQDWSVERWPPLNGSRGPFRSGWKPEPGATLLDYYRTGLREMVWWHAQGQVLNRFLKEFPDNGNHYDPVKFEEYINSYAMTSDEFNVLAGQELAAGNRGADLEQRLARVFPGMKGTKSLLDFIERERPYFVLRSQCFRAQKDGQALPWVRAEILTTVQDFHIRSEWRANRPKYLARIAIETGECRALVFRNFRPEDAVDSAALAKELSTDAGAIAQGGLAIARQTMARLGSNTHLGVIEGPATVVFGPELSRRMAVRQIVDAAPGIAVFLVSAPTLNPAVRKYYHSPEAEFAGIQAPVAEEVVRPIIRSVLTEYKAGAVDPPTEEELFSGFGSRSLSGKLFGRELPKYLKDPGK